MWYIILVYGIYNYMILYMVYNYIYIHTPYDIYNDMCMYMRKWELNAMWNSRLKQGQGRGRYWDNRWIMNKACRLVTDIVSMLFPHLGICTIVRWKCQHLRKPGIEYTEFFVLFSTFYSLKLFQNEKLNLKKLKIRFNESTNNTHLLYEVDVSNINLLKSYRKLNIKRNWNNT